MKTSGGGRQQVGVTLIELMVALAVLGIMMVVGAPSFRNATANSALRGTAMDLVAAINMARADAVNLRVPVRLEPLAGADWSSGWQLVYPAAFSEQDRAFNARPGVQVVDDLGAGALQFNANGTVSAQAEFVICDGRSGASGRRIELNRLGRMNNNVEICP